MKKLNKLLYLLAFGALANMSFAGFSNDGRVDITCDYVWKITDGGMNPIPNINGVVGWGAYHLTNSDSSNRASYLCQLSTGMSGQVVDRVMGEYQGWDVDHSGVYVGVADRKTAFSDVSLSYCASGGAGMTWGSSAKCAEGTPWVYLDKAVYLDYEVLHRRNGWYHYRLDVGICNGTPGHNCRFGVIFGTIFKDGTYNDYDISEKDARSSNLQILDRWHGISSDQVGNIVATLNLHNDKEYLFMKDGSYLLYDYANSQLVTGYPHQISDDFNGITSQQTQSIKAVVSYDEYKRAYFFLNDGTYLSYDVVNKKVEPGYPRKISSDFAGVSNNDALNITAVVNDYENTMYFILKDGKYLAYDNEQHKIKSGYPRLLSNDFSDISDKQSREILAVFQH